MSLCYVIVSLPAVDRHDWLWSGARGLLFQRKVLFKMSGKKRITDVILMSCVALKVVVLRLIPANLASGARLAAENESQAVGEKTFILTG